MKDQGGEDSLKKTRLPTENANSSDGIKLIQAGVCFLLCALIASLGSWFYLKLNNAEVSIFESQFYSATNSITNTVTQGIARKIKAASTVNNIFANAIDSGCGGVLPNFTLPGFETIMNDISDLAGLRLISFSPLVEPSTRKQWEQYAKENVGKLHGPAYLNVSTAGSWVVADGIFNITSRGNVRSTGYIHGSLYPTYLFPVWQTAPMKDNARAVMLDPHGLVGVRIKTIDKMIATKQTIFSDIITLYVDAGHLRPSTITYGPILSLKAGNPVVGLFCGAFSWDDVLKGILPEKFEIDCVITTKTSKFYIFSLSLLNCYHY